MKCILEENNLGLEQKAKEILGREYKQIKDYYAEIFKISDKYRNVVFQNRRGLVLAELFYNILLMESKDNELKTNMLKNALKKIISDSKLLNSSSEIATDLLNGNLYYKILLADELIVQGTSFNNLLDTFKDNIISKTSSLMDKDIVSSSINNLFDISVYGKNNDTFFLHPEYQNNLKSKCILNASEWHMLANKLNYLINNIPLTTSSFTPSATFIQNNYTFSDTQNFKMIKIISEETEQYVFILKGMGNSSIPTIRINTHKSFIDGLEYEKYEVIPFTFMPNIEITEFYNCIQELNKIYPNVFANYKSIFKQNELELMTMLINKMLLELFINDFSNMNKCVDSEFNCNAFKIASNFDLSDNVIKEFIEKKVDTASSLTFFKKLNSFNDKFAVYNNQIPNSLDFSNSKTIKKCEDVAYEKKLLDYRDKIINQQSTLRENNDYKYEVSLDKLHKEVNDSSIYEIVPFILHSLDNGIATSNIKLCENKYSQIFKLGDGALIIYPKRYYEHLRVLLTIKDENGFEYRCIKVAITNYVNKLNSSSKLNVTDDELVEELFNFLSYLNKTYQDFRSWNIVLYYDSKNQYKVMKKEMNWNFLY